MAKRMKLIADDLHEQVVEGIKNSPIEHCIQLDESTDIEKPVQIASLTELVQMQSFNLMQSSLYRESELNWNSCHIITSDGECPTIVGKHAGFVARGSSQFYCNFFISVYRINHFYKL